MSMLSEFKTFAMRGNVIDLAVGVVIGGALGSARVDAVQSAWRRTGVTGSATPAIRATSAAHAPAASTTTSACTGPWLVSTPVTRSPSRRTPQTAWPRAKRTPRRRAAAA